MESATSSAASAERQESTGGNWLTFVSSQRGPVAMAVMAVAGIAIAAYLTTVHYAKIPLVCTAGGVVNCSAVTSSRFSVVPGTQLPITVPGMLWFVVSGGLAVVALVAAWRGQAEPARLRAIHALWGAAGLLFVLYLVYAEIVQLHKVCEWCTVIHLLTLATFLIALVRWQRAGEDELTAPARASGPRRAPTSASTPATRAATRHAASSSTQRLPQRMRSASRSGAHNAKR